MWDKRNKPGICALLFRNFPRIYGPKKEEYAGLCAFGPDLKYSIRILVNKGLCGSHIQKSQIP